MSGRQLTQPEEALQHLVMLLGELHCVLAVAGLTRTYHDVFHV